MAELPSGTVTFLFTDIEGSTGRWERHPQAMRAALARHDALLQEGITAHGGVVLTERGEGDSFFALFARPSDALAAACALQQALAAEPWPEELAPVRVRMALHTGEAGMREGADYRGAAVNRCARLRAVGHGGQVLLSRATYELVRDTLPAEVTLRDLGERRLKDLTRPEHIYQIVQPELPSEFPPLKTLDQRRHNLPVQPTTLIGHEREVAEVRERLLDPRTRLLTLTGIGGTGKTRLALQVAAEVLEVFTDGTYFVNLAPLSDPALVLPTIAQTLGVTESGSQPLRETLQAFLHDKSLLLLLDNFEQVLEAAAVVSELLAACAGVRVLVTSRAALHLRGERLYGVPPLALPELTPLPPLERLTQYEAVRLFIERACDVRPDFAVTNATAPAVAEICARLDGLPLAIELAAARVRLFPPQALLSRLSDRLGVLTGGARDLPARQRTLRATIDWSYSLLSAEEQVLFARLAVFVGGRTLEAIEAVCNPEGTLDVLGGVESLLEKNLLIQTEVGGEPRLVMLETLHEYARERLDASRAADALRRHHAVYFLALAEEAEPDLRGPEQAAWLARLEQEHDNLRAALQWAEETGATASGLRMAAALSWFWHLQEHVDEGRAWSERLLARVDHTQVDILILTMARRGAAVLAADQNDYARATALFEECLAAYRDCGDTRRAATSLYDLGIAATHQGDYAHAIALYEQALPVQREHGDKRAIADTLRSLAYTAYYQGAYERAHEWGAESLALLQEVGGSHFYGAGTLLLLGLVRTELGDHARAQALLEEAMTLSQRLSRNTVGALEVIAGLARLASVQGHAERAARLFGAAAAWNGEARLPGWLSLSPAEQASWDSWIAAVRAALGHKAFERAWAQGQALPLEQAIAEALGEEAQT